MEPDQINIDQLAQEQPEDDGTSADILSPEQIVSENEAVDKAQVAYEQEIEQEASEDPRDKENWGVRGLVKEAGSIISGGIQDTVSSISTFPERTVDALSGEMQREKEEKGYYQPEFDPFGGGANPIITKTWWGKLARGVVHFGTLAGASVLAAKGAVAAGIPLAGTAAAKLLGAPSLVRAAGIGAVSDLISKESDGHNALGSLRDHYGWADTPLSTKDYDHPIMMKVKNIVEGMGIGLVFDGATMLIGKGARGAKTKIGKRQSSIDAQKLAKGLEELRQNESRFRASKNAMLSEAQQGAPLSKDDPYDIWEMQKKVREDWGAEEGAAGNPITNVQRTRAAENAGITEEVVDEVLRNLYSNNKYQGIIDEVKRNRLSLVDVFGDAIAAHQRITLGRNAADMSPEEYLKEILEATDAYSITDIDGNLVDSVETITSKYVVVADMVVGTLLQQVRDLGIAGRELKDFVDLADTDGPLEAIRDTIFVAMTEAKKARIIKSQNFRELGAGVKRNYLTKTLTKEMSDTRESIQTILDIADGSDDNELLMALFEAFSSMQTVNSLDDFDAWARKMIKGGEIEGKAQAGALIRELQGVMTHSVLSSPKTPLRAIIGTATHTFLRPMNQTLGGIIRYPFTGDTRTIRTGLASMNAMMEAIPESFELFKTRLNSYWSGDLATIKTRFSEYTQGDANWEILRRWAESDRASAGDKAAFRLANMARAMNHNSMLTYSTKVMAATDDAFAHILGRVRMREKALISAMDQMAGGKIKSFDNISPQLIRAYEDFFYRDIFDADGNLTDKAAQFARKEVTLTQDLKGFAANLNSVFQQNPWAKPFFLFARTGVNGLKLTAKHTPGFNFLVKEFNDIAFARPGQNLEELAQYGIYSNQDLINAKALQTGRLAMGSSLVSMATWAWMTGRMTGNGPVDRQKRGQWIDSGYQQRMIYFGDVGVNYDSFEPFNQIMSMVADIGDASLLMGEEWTEDNLLKVSLLLSQGVTSKSYLAGLQSFADLFGGKPGQASRIIASFANNNLPLAGIRNDLGKIFTPHTRELNSGIIDSIRNRNLLSENLTGKPLPIKYDLLNGKPIKNHDFITRAYNAFIPVNFNLTPSLGREFLFRSGYDIRLSVLFSPNGDDLTDSPELRSKFQREIGQEGLEVLLSRLAKDPKIIASLDLMYNDIDSGRRSEFDPKDYYHNIMIGRLFDSARKAAWNRVLQDEGAVLLAQERADKKLRKQLKKEESANITSSQNILNIYK
tara:strand:- start:21 stop:3761 length:3741 start_codon:yes stop_codon:yes gene_type:complete